MGNNFTSIFGIAHTDLQSHPVDNQRRTLRLVIQTNVKSKSIKFKLSNKYSKEDLIIGGLTIGICDEEGFILEKNKIVSVTLNNIGVFTILKHEDLMTDTIKFDLEIGEYLCVNIFYPEYKQVTSGNMVGNYGYRSIEGDYTKTQQLKTIGVLKKLSNRLLPYDIVTPITTIKEILVETEEKTNLLGVLGDSLTQQNAWVGSLQENIFNKRPGKLSVNNFGIGGNRLCYDSPEIFRGIYGESGLKRINWDLLELENLTHVIVALGTNDIGLPGRDGINLNELISLNQYISSQEEIVYKIKNKNKNIKIYGVTLLPRRITPLTFSEEREELRQEINYWIRNTNLFDDIVDFDYFAIDKNTFEPKNWFLIDHLHLSAEGGKELADYILLSLFD